MREFLRFSPVWQLTLAKVRTFLREPEAVFWVFAFPVLLAGALGIAFRSSRAPQTVVVGVEAGDEAEWMANALNATPGLRAEVLTADENRERLRHGRVALVVVPGETWVYRYDPTRPESHNARLAVDRALQAAAGQVPVRAVQPEEITERGSRYIDFLIPGLIGMNLMGTGMWGIGFAVVHARSRRLLKRLVSTPMRKRDFLLGQMYGRLAFLVLEVGFLLVFARLVFRVPLRGSLLTLAVFCVIGALTFSGLGLLVASRARSLEGISGLMNVVMVPMWILSGIFFSTSRFPDVMQPLIQSLPLTALNDALRGVMVDGASLWAMSGELAITTGWGAAAFVGALYLFRWQ